MKIASGGVTDVGRVRTNNEDCFRIVTPLNLYVLADGMGGEAHGEIASALAVETVVKHCMDAEANPAAQVLGQAQLGWSAKTKRLWTALHLANKNICKSAKEHPEQRGMGATLTAAWINGAKLSVAHVGDSRAYLLRSGSLLQLTRDHSLVAEQVRRGMLTVAEAEESEMQSVLLRALGAQPEIEVDAEEHLLFPRDVLLLCSDGLTRVVTEPEIAGVLQAETDPVRAAEELVGIANERGGPDNITVVIARLLKDTRKWFSWLRRGARKRLGNNGNAGGT
ncbi:MAG TPA: Stp1/IreP family PP2C-type Ser/Thr phosphatase [Candidatus Dormibacteraeota bacterium]|nr:Stp1/IreP family PP2C-type Ser/Thr phosphatase [Candidatus Dormibacteraeota bacterium]